MNFRPYPKYKPDGGINSAAIADLIKIIKGS